MEPDVAGSIPAGPATAPASPLRGRLLLVVGVLALVATSCIWPAGHFTHTVESEIYRTAGYVDGTSVDLGVTVYVPDTADGWERPGVVLWHAGGFVYGDPSHPGLVAMAEDLAGRGFVVFTPAHRLSPAVGPAPLVDDPDRVPPAGYWHGDQADPIDLGGHGLLGMYAAYEDALAFLDWLAPRLADFNVDADRVVMGGGSSGGITALNVEMLARGEADPPALLPAATMSMFGGFIPARAADLVTPDNSPLWMFQGAQDQVLWPEHAFDLQAAWTAEGLPHRIHVVEGVGHVAVDMLDPDQGPIPGTSWFDDLADFLFAELYPE